MLVQWTWSCGPCPFYTSESPGTIQAATIRLPDCLGQSLFDLGNYNLQKNCPTRQVQIGRLTPILSRKLQTSKINMFWLFPLHIYRPLCFYSGKFGQAVIWLSLPNRATKKKGHSCRLVHTHLICHFTCNLTKPLWTYSMEWIWYICLIPKLLAYKQLYVWPRLFYMQLPNCLHDKVKDEKIN